MVWIHIIIVSSSSSIGLYFETRKSDAASRSFPDGMANASEIPELKSPAIASGSVTNCVGPLVERPLAPVIVHCSAYATTLRLVLFETSTRYGLKGCTRCAHPGAATSILASKSGLDGETRLTPSA